MARQPAICSFSFLALLFCPPVAYQEDPCWPLQRRHKVSARGRHPRPDWALKTCLWGLLTSATGWPGKAWKQQTLSFLSTHSQRGQVCDYIISFVSWPPKSWPTMSNVQPIKQIPPSLQHILAFSGHSAAPPREPCPQWFPLASPLSSGYFVITPSFSVGF